MIHLKNTSDRNYGTICIIWTDLDSVLRIAGMNDTASADVNCHMSFVADDITRLHL